MHLRLRVRLGGAEAFEAEDIGEGLRAHNSCGREFAGSLGSESAPVHDEADAPEALRGQQPIQHRNREFGFAGAGCHGKQHRAPAGCQLRFDDLDSPLLVGP